MPPRMAVSVRVVPSLVVSQAKHAEVFLSPSVAALRASAGMRKRPGANGSMEAGTRVPTQWSRSVTARVSPALSMVARMWVSAGSARRSKRIRVRSLRAALSAVTGMVMVMGWLLVNCYGVMGGREMAVAGLRLPPDGFRFDIGVDADDNGQAVDLRGGGLVAVGACDGERLSGCGRTRRVQRDFDVEDVVLDGCFHGVVWGWGEEKVPGGGRSGHGRAGTGERARESGSGG